MKSSLYGMSIMTLLSMMCCQIPQCMEQKDNYDKIPFNKIKKNLTQEQKDIYSSIKFDISHWYQNKNKSNNYNFKDDISKIKSHIRTIIEKSDDIDNTMKYIDDTCRFITISHNFISENSEINLSADQYIKMINESIKIMNENSNIDIIDKNALEYCYKFMIKQSAPVPDFPKDK